MKYRYSPLKRLVDLSLGCVLLILTLPLQAVIALLVVVRLGAPVLFRQERPGLGGEIFTLVKFRSMKSVDVSKGLTSDAERLTPFGKLLRSTSLDELPTLWNVVRGDMSFVGPRPLLVEYLPEYSQTQSRRHEVRPGITGLAQVNGRNAISWDDKFKLDVQYVDSYSPLLDLQILAQTFKVVFARHGISHEGHVTMKPFGNSDVD